MAGVLTVADDRSVLPRYIDRSVNSVSKRDQRPLTRTMAPQKFACRLLYLLVRLANLILGFTQLTKLTTVFVRDFPY